MLRRFCGLAVSCLFSSNRGNFISTGVFSFTLVHTSVTLGLGGSFGIAGGAGAPGGFGACGAPGTPGIFTPGILNPGIFAPGTAGAAGRAGLAGVSTGGKV